MSALKKITTAAVTTLALGSMLAVTTVSADAGPRGGWNRHHHHHHYNRRHHNNKNRDNGLVAGIIGLGAGLIIGNALATPSYAAPPPPPPAYAPSYRPWTPQWRASCASRYRSFNPSTGYFLGYDGQYHFCR